MEEQLTVSNINIDVVRKNIKNIHLGVYPPDGVVRIAVPLKTNEDAIRLFIVSKLSWIKRSQKKFEEQERLSDREFKQRESHYFLGKRYLLNVIEDKKPRVFVKNKTHLNLYVKPNSTQKQKALIINKWYRDELKKRIPSLIKKWEDLMNVKVTDWRIKQMKTKWGTCNIEQKRVWINLELAKKPEHCLEYIIVHEMTHLSIRHHNEQFLYLMDKYLPNWRQLKTELNKLPIG